jgi:hypothetical protein
MNSKIQSMYCMSLLSVIFLCHFSIYLFEIFFFFHFINIKQSSMHIDIDSVKDEQKETLTDKLGPFEERPTKKPSHSICMCLIIFIYSCIYNANMVIYTVFVSIFQKINTNAVLGSIVCLFVCLQVLYSGKGCLLI